MAVVDKYLIDVRTQGVGKSKKQLGGVAKASNSLAKSVAGLGAAYLTATGLISGVKASIDAFAKQELAQKKLETALGFTSNALLEQARALQQVSMFGDEDIIMMQSMLASFVDSETEIKKLTVATLDLASGMGIDLKNAGDLIAKTIGSSTNALSRYGIQVDGAVGSSERLETLTGNIANLFGGQAKAQSETMMGSMEQMKNAIGDTAEAFGGLLSPAVIGSARVLKGMAESLSNAIDDFDRFMGGGANVAGVLSDLEYQSILFDRQLESITGNQAALLELGEKIVKLRDEEQTSTGLATDQLLMYEEQLGKINTALNELGKSHEQLELRTDKAAKVVEKHRDVYAGFQKVAIKSVKEVDKEEQLYYASSLSGLRSMIKSKIQAYSAEMFAGLLSKEISSKGIIGIATASAGAILAGQLFEQIVPQFEQAALIGGRRHSQGGTMIEAEKGEFVMLLILLELKILIE